MYSCPVCIKWQAVSLQNLSVGFPDLLKHNEMQCISLLGCLSCLLSYGTNSKDPVVADYMIIQKESIFRSFRHSSSFLPLTWKDELQSWLRSSYSSALPEDSLFESLSLFLWFLPPTPALQTFGRIHLLQLSVLGIFIYSLDEDYNSALCIFLEL